MNILEMMQSNIENQKKNIATTSKIEKATDHLINPKEIQMMEINQKNRYKSTL